MNLEPKNLNEIVDSLIEEINNQEATKHVQESGIPHHGAGTSIRNSLHLWWQEDWPEKHSIEKPPLVQWFNDKNIYHADDMSGTISAAVQSKLKGEDFDVDKHLERYFRHWKKYGYKDGICKEEFRISNLDKD